MADETKEYQQQDCAKNVKDYLKLDDEIALLKAKVKVLKNKQKEISHHIIHFMKTTDTEELTFEGGGLQYVVKDSYGSITKKTVQNTLNQLMPNDQEKSETWMSMFLENREKKQNVSLKRFLTNE